MVCNPKLKDTITGSPKRSFSSSNNNSHQPQQITHSLLLDRDFLLSLHETVLHQRNGHRAVKYNTCSVPISFYHVIYAVVYNFIVNSICQSSTPLSIFSLRITHCKR
mmetsp:Transcript_9438/g.13951  ORF Transcript_9438/g.13951 Transcript_9438/m.13951 type:complete len:107 (+) Transcript_9438:1843-2163(+)